MSNRLKQLALQEIKILTDDIMSDMMSSVAKIDEEYYERNFNEYIKKEQRQRVSDAMTQISKTKSRLEDLTNALHFFRESSYLDSLAWSTDSGEKKEPDIDD